MIDIIDKKKCCGCGACVQACEKKCILFEEDAEGFRYPQVDSAKCTKCGACEKVCPVLYRKPPRQPISCFAAKSLDEHIREKSSSGGVFTLLAERTVLAGGVVFGAKFNSEWEVVHDYTETVEGIAGFRTSKYVQSRIGNSFRKAKGFLSQGRPVLFSGTPCQIAGLHGYLRKGYDNLLTVDIICHGVPSPGVWRRYLAAVRKNVRKGENSVSSPLTHGVLGHDALDGCGSVSIESISFRDKRLGWKKYSFALTLAEASADGKQNTVSFSHIHHDNPFMQAFLSNMILRPSCYDCPSKGGRSGSDVTLADYWGIDQQMPDYDDDRGVSLLLVNTSKGAGACHGLAVESREVTVKDALAHNLSFYWAVQPHVNRDRFFRKYAKSDIDILCLIDTCLHISLPIRISHKMKRSIKKVWNKANKVLSILNFAQRIK